jgi:hypothetical protein
LPNLNRRQRRVLRDHVARTCRQLGFDAYRAGHFGRAARRLAESFVHRPALSTLRDVADAGLRSMWPKPGREQPTQLPGRIAETAQALAPRPTD